MDTLTKQYVNGAILFASYVSVSKRGRTWFRPAIIDAECNVLWSADVLMNSKREAKQLAKVAM